jgi:hypothetical protein
MELLYLQPFSKDASHPHNVRSNSWTLFIDILQKIKTIFLTFSSKFYCLQNTKCDTLVNDYQFFFWSSNIIKIENVFSVLKLWQTGLNFYSWHLCDQRKSNSTENECCVRMCGTNFRNFEIEEFLVKQNSSKLFWPQINWSWMVQLEMYFTETTFLLGIQGMLHT